MPSPLKPSTRLLAFGLGLACSWLGAAPTRAVAGLVLSVANSTAPSGGTGSFDVLLSDTGTTSYQVAGFSVRLTVAMASGVEFQAANTNTTAASYIFGTLQSPPFSFNPPPNYDFTVSDSPLSTPGYVTLAPGAMVGLEHVTYSVAPGTPTGPVIVTVADIGGGTSLSDNAGGSIPFTPANGTITVTPSAVPEPASLGLLATALIGTALVVRGRRLRPAR